MGTQRMPKMIIILSILERILFTLFDGFLSSLKPQYIVDGNEIIPIQVMKVPRGMELELSNVIVNKEEPVAKRIIDDKVATKELRKEIFLLSIF